MTLIIKELIITGTVSSNNSSNKPAIHDRNAIKKAMEDMKDTIKQECIESIMRKIDSQNAR